MENSKNPRPWYELPQNKEFIMRTSREAPRAFLWNLWAPKVMVGKAAIGFSALYILQMLKDEPKKRALIITDPFLEKYAIRVQKSLKARGIECEIWKGVEPEAPIDSIKKGVKVCEHFKPQVLFAVGGGSVLDTAKMVLLLYENPDIDLYNLIPLNFIGLRNKIKIFIAIPTTSGTGSEATFGSVIKDTSQEPPKKINISIMELIPDIAILSTEFVEKLPQKLTAGTGIDALVHAISAYLCNCHNTLTDLFTLDAIRLILKYLPRTYKRGADLEAREKMQIAAFLSGVCISNSGISMDHSLAHSFGSLFPVHHGIAVGIFCIYAVQFLAKNSDRYKDIAELFGIELKNKTNDEILKEFTAKYKEFLYSLNMPTCVKEIEPSISFEEYKNKLDELVQYAWDDICTFDNVRIPTKDDFRKIYLYAYEGKDIDF
ncbi:MAG: iron-containing alcohol dehydrogenase [Promethearchaeota archaeon]